MVDPVAMAEDEAAAAGAEDAPEAHTVQMTVSMQLLEREPVEAAPA